MAFLDLRTSQGQKSGPVSLVAGAPDYIAGIGLDVGTAANIRVDLEASVGVASPISNSFEISVVRHINPGDLGNFGSGTVVYSQTFSLPVFITMTATTFSLSAADLPPTPASGLLVYGLYASANLPASYQGTQNLIGTAAS